MSKYDLDAFSIYVFINVLTIIGAVLILIFNFFIRPLFF